MRDERKKTMQNTFRVPIFQISIGIKVNTLLGHRRSKNSKSLPRKRLIAIWQLMTSVT